MDIFDLIGIGISIFGAVLAWYSMTRKKRLFESLKDYEKQISKIEEYSKTVGYKAVINDCFLLLFYVLSVLCISTGIFVLSITFMNIEFLRDCATSFYCGVIIGVGIGCYNNYKLLSRTKKPHEAIPELESKMKKINKKIEVV